MDSVYNKSNVILTLPHGRQNLNFRGLTLQLMAMGKLT